MKTSKNILVAPLNWGLGHSTRCIPIINKLLEFGYNPILASDGEALALLRKEFPQLTILELPSYEIKYAKKGHLFKWKIAKNAPKILKAVKSERKIVKEWIKEYNISGIISDNRFGVMSKKIPSVFITHQLNVLSGTTTYFTSVIHRNWIKKFNECWIPDIKGKPNLSGKLGHLKKTKIKIRYIGVLSRFSKKETDEIYDLAIILSGPEPQRTMFEEIIIPQLERYKGKVVFVKGKIESEKQNETIDNVTYYNFMNSWELEKILNESKLVLSRSGYTTIMDLVKLQKKAFFVPTPGQTEQEYLAKKFKKQRIAPFCTQSKFEIENLEEVFMYEGFTDFGHNEKWDFLFRIFEGKR